jgi:hypothetical protein
MGIVAVARCAARAAGVAIATIISTGRLTSSDASRETFAGPIAPSLLDNEVAPLDVAEIRQSLPNASKTSARSAVLLAHFSLPHRAATASSAYRKIPEPNPTRT